MGLRQETIARFENGKSTPNEVQLQAIAAITGVSPAFFTKEPGQADVGAALAYRCKARVPVKDKAQASQYVLLLAELVKSLCATLRPPALNFPTPSTEPEKAARFMRTVFGLAEGEPIAHVVNVLERNGAVVLAFPEFPEKSDRKPNRRIDAISTWGTFDKDRPIVGVFATSAGDRLRFNVAHELGHLVLHRNLEVHTKATEDEANRFAAEFLMPEHRMVQVLPEALNLGLAMEIKKEWRVSLQMIVRRARDVGVIADHRYKTLMAQIGARGWRTNEPVQVPIERPRLIRQMVEMKYGPEIIRETANSLCITEQFAEEILKPFASASRLDRFEAGTEPYEYPGGDPNQNN